METNDKVVKILKELSGKETIERTDHLQNDLSLDSLEMVTLLIELEDVFGFELKEADMNPFDLATIADVVELVERYGEDHNEEEN